MQSTRITLREDWRNVLAAAVQRSGRSKRGVSIAAGLYETAVSEWIRRGKRPSAEALASVAAVLDIDQNALFEESSNGAPMVAWSGAHVPAPMIPVIGEVKRGGWQEGDILEQAAGSYVPAVVVPEYAHLRAYAFEVRDETMSYRAPVGSHAICVLFDDLEREPHDKELVIAETEWGNLHEHTLRRFREIGGESWFEPDTKEIPAGPVAVANATNSHPLRARFKVIAITLLTG